MSRTAKLIKLNNLQYNPNRDPQFYRRTIDQEFRLQVVLEGTGTATVRFTAEDTVLCEQSVALPGSFDCRFSFASPGSRVGVLTVEANGAREQQYIRLDVEERAWIG